MVFFCQRNCYTKEFITKAVSCNSSKTETTIDGKKVKVDCYEVTFEDTVFFPEGGGQPYDIGYVNDVRVFKVIRKGGEAIHYLDAPLELGSCVTQVLDWTRRYDHMQQHSGQHLITAIADHQFGYPTVSWNLGEKVSYVELDTTKISEKQLAELEEIVNDKIQRAVPVTIIEYDGTDPQLLEVRTRGLPDDISGPVRVVTIEGIDSNMCCGTHVRNLSDIQSIKVLYVEKGKANRILLYFVAGKRVLSYLGECVTRERVINTLLHSNPQDHVRLIEKCKKELKQANKSLSEALRDVALAEVYKFNIVSPKPKIFFHHRRDGDSEYLGTLISAIDDDNILKVLSVGEDSGPGILIIHGPLDQINAISSRVCDILEGKGGGKTRFTAKVNKLGRRKEMEKYIRETLDL